MTTPQTPHRDNSSPTQRFALLPLRDGVLFPGSVATLPVGRKRSLSLVRALDVGDELAIAVQRDPQQSNPGIADLHRFATRARVRRIVRAERGLYNLIVEGIERLEIGGLVQSEPHWICEATPIPEADPDEEASALAESLREQLVALTQNDPRSLELGPAHSPGVVADRVAANLGLETDQEVRVLSTLPLAERLRLVIKLVGEAKERSELRKKIDAEVRQELGRNQREAILREQLRAIRRELGEGDADGDSEAEKLRARAEARDLPDEVSEVVEAQLTRLESMPPQQAEFQVIRTYLEWILDLPWDERAELKADLNGISDKLDEDHYGLEEVKKRILEHMAVLTMSASARGNILCLAGPPGVGKTSLGQSIADATGRPFVRIALGGVRDEAELRGHRRTYVGALPGRIVHALKKAGAKNPVILLDEVDKLGQGWMGSPEAALLEVLDPEQNHTFTDHYLELPFDLSEVLFICTANDLGGISAPLRDRLEIVELGGYTEEEKLHIAQRHLIPKQLEAHALSSEMLEISEEALRHIIGDYTREAGVRQLQREIVKICRGIALRAARQQDRKLSAQRIAVDDLNDFLGKVRFHSEVAERTSVPGVATGLAWTPVGGDILFIETTRMPGKGRIEITGKLGEVMTESARAALTYVRSQADALEVDPDFLEKQDLHIHVPAGAVPKDGPSAGVTIFTALTSLLTGRRVRSDTAMTGECTLRGRVMPVGGIKEKVLAAHRAGITRVILPQRNERDIDDIPPSVRDSLEIILAGDMSEVLAAALEAPGGAGLGLGGEAHSDSAPPSHAA